MPPQGDGLWICEDGSLIVVDGEEEWRSPTCACPSSKVTLIMNWIVAVVRKLVSVASGAVSVVGEVASIGEAVTSMGWDSHS